MYFLGIRGELNELSPVKPLDQYLTAEQHSVIMLITVPGFGLGAQGGEKATTQAVKKLQSAGERLFSR